MTWVLGLQLHLLMFPSSWLCSRHSKILSILQSPRSPLLLGLHTCFCISLFNELLLTSQIKAHSVWDTFPDAVDEMKCFHSSLHYPSTTSITLVCTASSIARLPRQAVYSERRPFFQHRSSCPQYGAHCQGTESTLQIPHEWINEQLLLLFQLIKQGNRPYPKCHGSVNRSEQPQHQGL